MNHMITVAHRTWNFEQVALGKEVEKADVSGVSSGYRKRRAQERTGSLLAEQKGRESFPNVWPGRSRKQTTLNPQ